MSRHIFALAYLGCCYIFAHWLFSMSDAVAGDVWMQFVVGSVFFLISCGLVIGIREFGRFV
jgi:hypothetical protein